MYLTAVHFEKYTMYESDYCIPFYNLKLNFLHQLQYQLWQPHSTTSLLLECIEDPLHISHYQLHRKPISNKKYIKTLLRNNFQLLPINTHPWSFPNGRLKVERLHTCNYVCDKDFSTGQEPGKLTGCEQTFAWLFYQIFSNRSSELFLSFF